MINKRIVTLIGMMGTGKSKFGRLAAEDLNCNFYDVDSIIEEEQKSTINKIFNDKGEKFFRTLEKDVIKNLILYTIKDEKKAIVSLGGGGFDNVETRKILLDNTFIIWLNTPIDTLVKRVGDGTKRPMIKGNIRESIETLLFKRAKYYSLSHHQINTHKLNQTQILKKLLTIISC